MTTLAERMNLLASTAKSGKTDKDGFRTRGQLPHVFDYDTPEVLTATDHTKRQNIRNKIKRKLLKLSQPPKEKKPRISRSRAHRASLRCF